MCVKLTVQCATYCRSILDIDGARDLSCADLEPMSVDEAQYDLRVERLLAMAPPHPSVSRSRSKPLPTSTCRAHERDFVIPLHPVRSRRRETVGSSRRPPLAALRAVDQRSTCLLAARLVKPPHVTFT